jgi:uncharacterized protein (DUF2336 family)
MSSADSLVTEIKDVLDGVQPSRRTAILRDMTDLFLEGVDVYSAEQIAVFGEALSAVVDHAERDELIELSKRLLPCAKAPSAVMRKLASNTDMKISGAVLEQCTVLTDEDLADVAATATSVQLMIIAGRDGIGESVTDALINRGDIEVMRKFVVNDNARVSHIGFVKLINAAKRDGSLIEIVASRTDLPEELKPFIGMLRRSSEAAQAGAQQAGVQQAGVQSVAAAG